MTQATKMCIRDRSKGVRIAFEDDGIRVDLSIILEYGCSIPEVTAAVQDRVKSSIETMTGLKVSDVNIRVADVKIDNESVSYTHLENAMAKFVKIAPMTAKQAILNNSC